MIEGEDRNNVTRPNLRIPPPRRLRSRMSPSSHRACFDRIWRQGLGLGTKIMKRMVMSTTESSYKTTMGRSHFYEVWIRLLTNSFRVVLSQSRFFSKRLFQIWCAAESCDLKSFRCKLFSLKKLFRYKVMCECEFFRQTRFSKIPFISKSVRFKLDWHEVGVFLWTSNFKSLLTEAVTFEFQFIALHFQRAKTVVFSILYAKVVWIILCECLLGKSLLLLRFSRSCTFKWYLCIGVWLGIC